MNILFSSVPQSHTTLYNSMDCSMPGFPVHQQVPKCTQIHVHWVWWCHPTISSSLIPFSSGLQCFSESNESVLHIRWPKYWSFSFSIRPSNVYSGLISFRMDFFRLDFLAVQGTLKSLLQHHSSKTSILRHSAFFIVQLSYPYMTTEKNTALTRRTFVDKVMSLLLNMGCLGCS